MDDAKEVLAAYPSSCVMNDCYLPASNSFGSGRENATCRFHCDSDPSQVEQITERIIEFRPMFDLIAYLTTMSAVERSLMSPELVPGYPESAPLQGECTNLWLHRMVSMVNGMVVNDLNKPNNGRGGSGVVLTFKMLISKVLRKAA
jgi:hypothetical protein